MNHTIYVKDHDLWARVRASANAQNKSISQFIEDALHKACGNAEKPADVHLASAFTVLESLKVALKAL